MQNTSAEAEVFFFCPPLADGQKRRAKGKRSHACVVFCIESPKRSRKEAPPAEHYYKAPADETSDADDGASACRGQKRRAKGKRSHVYVLFCIESPKRSRKEAPLAEHYYKAPADETSDANDGTPACRRAKAAGKRKTQPRLRGVLHWGFMRPIRNSENTASSV